MSPLGRMGGGCLVNCDLKQSYLGPRSASTRHIFIYSYMHTFVYSYKDICKKTMILCQYTIRPNVRVVAQPFFQENFHPAKEISIIFTNF